ncbi:Putative nucleoside-diphosphate sugar epimerase [Idiomarina sp. A28L]|uniref:nucleoside-diphosphate sugar epimerase/dehydratase n=1 Tax=Idiomarina sp. A28L TaxID=1036674 RepID=UPI0002138C45|nr:nucleoside-diphosphate sugar epimerase/dehydratase [Idiomarina sp. A28L]EGN74602.1 Putative nucleoside-diphosphate sugar epimerase [Idiomarina sp. A28L]
MIRKLITLPRNQKRAVAVAIDVLALIFSYAFALSVRYETLYIPAEPDVAWAFLLSLPVSLLLFVRFGLYRAVVRYMALSALLVITLGVLSSAVVLAAAIWALQAPVPYSVVINYALMSLVIAGGLRLLMRAMYEQKVSRRKQRVIIYGAGSAGRQLAHSLINGAEYHPVCFIDDDPTLQGSTVLGLRVCSPQKIQELLTQFEPKLVLLAMPSATRSRRREILDTLEPLRVSVQTIPGMSDMVSGNMQIDELQDVRIEDLLGRDPVEPRKRLMETNIRDKAVLVTGAGGSIGSELCRQIIQHEPRVLVLVEVSEYNLYAIEKELQALVAEAATQGKTEILIKPVLASVQNQNRLTRLMQRFAINTVYHAAAYKHVPMVEFNVVEGVRNNIFGTLRTAESAIAAGVSDFVLISTDKAVRPTNVMGATKRFAELVLQALALREGVSTHFSMVRFGNVLGSSGSVVPLFRQQIENGGPVTVTHADITRYFMTIPEAAQLVIQAGAMGSISAAEQHNNGGQVFVLDMGEPVRIVELAQKLIRLMGLEVKDEHNPHGDIAIVYSGLRPGEKLYEELLIGDDVQPSNHPRILTARELHLSWMELSEYLQKLDSFCTAFSVNEIHQLLQEAPLAFAPTSDICDLTWQPQRKTAVADIPHLDDELEEKLK